MAKKSILEREKKKSKIFFENCYKRLSLKNKLKKEKDVDQKNILSESIQKLNRNSSITRVSKRCFITLRKRGVYQFFNLSKSSIRLLVSSGFAPYVTKSSF
jgi:small subunit ribosomal protein S14